MADQHQAFVDLALQLITQEGRAAVLQKVDQNAASATPWEPGSGGETISSISIVMATFGSTEGGLEAVLTQVAGAGDRENTALKVNQTIALIPAAGLSEEVSIDDRILDGDITWEVKSVIKEQPGSTPIMYTAMLEK